MPKRLYSVSEAAKIAEIGLEAAYTEIRAKGTLCGVPIIRAGVRITKVPKVAFDAMLDGGTTTNSPRAA